MIDELPHDHSEFYLDDLERVGARIHPWIVQIANKFIEKGHRVKVYAGRRGRVSNNRDLPGTVSIGLRENSDRSYPYKAKINYRDNETNDNYTPQGERIQRAILADWGNVVNIRWNGRGSSSIKVLYPEP